MTTKMSYSHTVLSQWQSFVKQTGTEFDEDSAGVAIDGKSLDLSIIVAVARSVRYHSFYVLIPAID
jgi:hypothetical protein